METEATAMTASLACLTRGFAPSRQQTLLGTSRLPVWLWSVFVQHDARRFFRQIVLQRAINPQLAASTHSTTRKSTGVSSDGKLDVSDESEQPTGSHDDGNPHEHHKFRFPLSILYHARKKKNQSTSGLLTNLASQDSSLREFQSLACALLQLRIEQASSQDESLTITQPLSLFSDSQTVTSLETFTEKLFSFEKSANTKPIETVFSQVSEDWGRRRRDEESQAYCDSIGELWYALGDITIRASNMTVNEADRLMYHAYLVLAEMHSHGFVPSDTYGFDDSSVPKPRRKPPYLHTLGSRMMATLSDAEWKTHSQNRSSDSDGSAHNTLENIYYDPSPRVRRLHPNTWLEFVLWSCVRQRYFVEAAKLLSVSCLAQERGNWVLLTWDQVLELQVDHHKRHQSWFDRVMTLVEGYNEGWWLPSST